MPQLNLMEESIMSSEDKQYDQRLETVLDFLSKEISATSGSAQGKESQAEDIDSVVSNLLQQVVRDSEAAPENRTHEVERNSIDSMFAGMFGHEELKSNPESIFEDAVPQADKLPDNGRKEIGVTGKGNVRQFPAEKPQPEMASFPETIRSTHSPAEQALASTNVAPASREIESPAPTVRVAKGELKPARNSTMIIVLGCLAVVLVVAGSYFLTSHNGTESAAVSSSIPVESTDVPANAPVTTPAPAVEKNAVMAASSSSATRSPVASSTTTEPASTLTEPQAMRRPTAAAAVPNSSLVERVPSPATPPVTAETVALTPTPAVTPIPESPAVSMPAFSLPALPQDQQPRVAAPIMITAPAPAPSSAPAKPKTAVPPQDLIQAVAVQKVAPIYPELAKRFNVTGTVTLDIQISETGRVTQSAVLSGPKMLHSAALDAVRQWRFKPASLNGNNVTSRGSVSIVFNTSR